MYINSLNGNANNKHNLYQFWMSTMLHYLIINKQIIEQTHTQWSVFIVCEWAAHFSNNKQRIVD